MIRLACFAAGLIVGYGAAAWVAIRRVDKLLAGLAKPATPQLDDAAIDRIHRRINTNVVPLPTPQRRSPA